MISEPIVRWQKVYPWVLAALPFVFMVAWFWNRGPGLDANDYALTLLHARALVEGRPYGATGLITTPLNLQAPSQPPGLPLLLAGVTLLAGGFHWAVVKLALAVTAFPFLLVTGLYFSRQHGRAVGIAVMVMLTVAVAAKAPQAATHVQTDLGFAGLVWGLVFLLDRSEDMSWPRVACIFALGSLAVAYRLLGAVLIPTVAAFALVHRDARSRRLAVPVAVWLAGGAAAVAVVGWGPITSQMSLDPRRLLGDFRSLVRFYGLPAAEAHLYPLPGDMANDVFHAVSLSLAVVGLVSWSKSSWRSAAWLFAALYAVLLGQVYARDGRYLIPAYPLLIFGFLNGLGILLHTVRRAWSSALVNRVVAGTGMVVAASALMIMIRQVPRTGGYLAELPETRSLFAFLEAEESTEEIRVSFTQAHVLTWATGIRSMMLLGTPPRVTMPELDRLHITHVVLDRLDLAPRRTEPMRETIAANACRFSPAFDNGAFQVYRVLPPCDEAADDGRATLERRQVAPPEPHPSPIRLPPSSALTRA